MKPQNGRDGIVFVPEPVQPQEALITPYYIFSAGNYAIALAFMGCNSLSQPAGFVCDEYCRMLCPAVKGVHPSVPFEVSESQAPEAVENQG